jgi:hypothetical protein
MPTLTCVAVVPALVVGAVVGTRDSDADIVALMRQARRVEGALVQRHMTGLHELRFAHEQYAFRPIDVTAVELHCLTDPQAGGGEQSNQRLECRCSQRLGNHGRYKPLDSVLAFLESLD